MAEHPSELTLKYLGGFNISYQGRMLPISITQKVLAGAANAGVKLKLGQLFKVHSKGKPLDLKIDGAEEFVFKLVTPTADPQPDTAPQTLVDWYQWLDALHHKWPKDGIDRLRDAVMTAQVFEFGNISEARLERENARAAKFSQQGYLRLPFKCVIYRWTGEKSGRVTNIVLDDGNPDDMPMVQWGGQAATDAARAAGTPGEVVMGKDILAGHLIWPLSMMLVTKGVKMRVEEPSHKLQTKRAARGKHPLPRITYVDAEHYAVAMKNADDPKGHHASPVPHLRRGHLRHYVNGHTVWIKDMLVNCKSLDEIKEPRVRYQIGGLTT